MKEKSKVYAKIGKDNKIVGIEGGYTTPADLNGWVLIDEGEGDKYRLCQSHYLPKPLTDDHGIYRYEWNGAVFERSQAAMDADRAEIEPEPTEFDRLAAQVMWTALMTGTFLEG